MYFTSPPDTVFFPGKWPAGFYKVYRLNDYETWKNVMGTRPYVPGNYIEYKGEIVDRLKDGVYVSSPIGILPQPILKWIKEVLSFIPWWIWLIIGVLVYNNIKK
jgi:hypothetical protein